MRRKRDRLVKEVEEIEKGMGKDGFFVDFMRKHKIESLEDFRNMSDLGTIEQEMKQKSLLLSLIHI